MDHPREAIIVTGSSGLIGTAIIHQLAGRFRLFGFDRAGPPHPPEVAEAIDVDVTDDEQIARGLATVRERHGGRIASVIHLAAYYDFSGEPSPLYEEVTVRGTARLLHALRDFEVEQFIFSSTMLVHAPCSPGERIDEAWPVEPKWDYPQSKLRTEQLIRAERGTTPVVLARIAGVYDERGHSIPLVQQLVRIHERRLTSHLYPGDLAHGQAFVHREDAAAALALLVEQRRSLPPELPLLIGEMETCGYGELQQAFGQLLHGEAWETREIPKVLAKAGAWVEDTLPLGDEPFIKPWMIDLADDHYALDCGRARHLIGWEPRHSLRDTLPAMVAAFKADPVAWYRENKLDPPDELAARGDSASDTTGQ